MAKNTKQKKHETFIHIKADSKLISINAIVPESKSISILEDLRDNFKKVNERYGNKDSLTVKTCVHNPTLL